MTNKLALDPTCKVENESLYIVNNPISINVYSVHLTESVGDSKNYRELYDLIRNAEENDYFKLFMCNRGGLLDTGLEIINAIRATKSTVVAYLTGGNYSMAPLIALAAHKLVVEEDSFFMFHDYSGGMYGKGNELAAQIAHEKPHIDNIFRKVTDKFLTKKELSRVLSGQDLYLGPEQIRQRLKKMGKLGVPKVSGDIE